jgi:hypothetical protein
MAAEAAAAAGTEAAETRYPLSLPRGLVDAQDLQSYESDLVERAKDQFVADDAASSLELREYVHPSCPPVLAAGVEDEYQHGGKRGKVDATKDAGLSSTVIVATVEELEATLQVKTLLFHRLQLHRAITRVLVPGW